MRPHRVLRVALEDLVDHEVPWEQRGVPIEDVGQEVLDGVQLRRVGQVEGGGKGGDLLDAGLHDLTDALVVHAAHDPAHAGEGGVPHGAVLVAQGVRAQEGVAGQSRRHGAASHRALQKGAQQAELGGVAALSRGHHLHENKIRLTRKKQFFNYIFKNRLFAQTIIQKRFCN